ncbi:hypothetical protein [Allomuricauda sp. CP2A]|uniref:hypothetical protein n=1 Tax=Allomuricauda sp. CP2A TaxID=1848189 RepID=UPI00391974F7
MNYRPGSKNKAAPLEALKDAKSAVRFVRENASAFRFDKYKIIVPGVSAKG